MMKIQKEDPCADAKKCCAGQKRAKNMDAVEYMIAKQTRRKKFKDNKQKTDHYIKKSKTKMI